ncbi:MAG: PLP-dependent transferase [Collinsella sp.]
MFGETIANPALAVLDIERFAAAAHAHGVPLIVDNTFPTPINCRPFEWGADIVTHSTTKYMDGHGAAVGGAIVDSGSFDWMAHADKFPGLTTPDETLPRRDLRRAHSVSRRCLHHQGDRPAHARPRMHPEPPERLPAAISVWRACMCACRSTARTVRPWRSSSPSHPAVRFVRYPGLPGDEYYELAQKYLPNGSCGVVSFGFNGGREAAEQFMKSLKIAQIATHVADARTCCLHPANATHRQMNDAELEACGIAPDMVRLSCGIESTDDPDR